MTGTAVGEARTYAETVLEFTWEAYETAAAHGWGGIATTMGQTAEHLEGVLEQLHAAQQSCATAATTLDGIDATTSSPEVIEHLGATFAALEQAQTTCQGALDLIDEATQNSEAVGVESLTTAVFTLRENTEQIHEQLGVLHTEGTPNAGPPRTTPAAVRARHDGESGPGGGGRTSRTVTYPTTEQTRFKSIEPDHSIETQ
jgi:hypothetical protein